MDSDGWWWIMIHSLMPNHKGKLQNWTAGSNDKTLLFIIKMNVLYFTVFNRSHQNLLWRATTISMSIFNFGWLNSKWPVTNTRTLNKRQIGRKHPRSPCKCAEEPEASIPCRVQEFGLSKTSTWRILGRGIISLLYQIHLYQQESFTYYTRRRRRTIFQHIPL